MQYAEETIECRRVLLLRHFAEHFEPGTCQRTCDNCRKRKDEEVEYKVTNRHQQQLSSLCDVQLMS